MMYIAKLARRLALLRDAGDAADPWPGRDAVNSLLMLPLLVLAAACTAGEPTGLPTGSLPTEGPSPNAAVVLSPRRVTLEANQLIQFRAYDGLGPGSNLVTAVEWTATGGTIRSDGSYSSSTTGDFKVIATRQGNGNAYAYGRDTARVKVVPPQPTLAAVVLSPASATVMAGAQVQFTATGKLSDGSVVEIGVTWSATGGTIDAGGLYTAGASPGTFQVTATSVSAGLSATATVTVTALTGLKLNPSSASLPTGGTQQFSVTGVMSDSTTVPVANATFSATGGTITSTGLYTAPATAGSYTVTATLATGTGTLSTSAVVTVTAPPAPPPGGSTEYPHQPSGMTRISYRQWDSFGEADWFETLNSKYTIVPDGSAPSGPTVGRILFPAGFAGGNAPAYTNTPVLPTNLRFSTAYISFWVKVSSNWYGHSVVNKIGFAWIGGKPKCDYALQGAGTGSLYLQMRLQDLYTGSGGPDAINLPNNLSSGTFSRGVWHHVELLLVANSSTGTADGHLYWWLDGVAVGSATNIAWIGPGQSSVWEAFSWFPVWGGSGGTVPADQYMYLDNYYVSGK